MGHRYRLLGRSSKHAAGDMGLIVSKVPGLQGAGSAEAHSAATGRAVGADHTCGWPGQLLRELAFLPIELGMIVMVC